MNKPKYIVKPTSQFKKDYKSAIKRNMNIKALDDVIKKIANGEKLEDKYRDHALSGQWAGHRECHIEPDWLLIYFIKVEADILTLSLTRTETHSDLF